MQLASFAVLVLGTFMSQVAAQSTTAPTTINISDTAKLTNAKRMGLNLGTQDFYDAGIFMRNLTFNNPGFEGEVWQSILHCKYVTATSCTDDDQYAYWPANFFKGADAEFIAGRATGVRATVTSNAAANTSAGRGVTVNFASLATAPAVGDYVVVRMQVPGGADQGWWTQSSAPNAFTTEFKDLSPNTVGKQALRITTGANQYATVNAYIDSTPGKSFLQLNGLYTLTFRAKGTGGTKQVQVNLSRPSKTFFNQVVTLTDSWQDYSFSFQATDTKQVGTLALLFKLTGSSMLLDDVALTAAADPDNPTAYRNEVVTTLKNLRPGILRYMDSGTDWGSSIDNMIAPDFARMRSGYNDYQTVAGQIPMGLQDYLVLCQAIGAEPWYTMQTGMSTQEMSNLMDYLGGSSSTEYGARRAAMGQTAPWTSVFKKIHLEFGNEVWNTSNPGASMTDPTAYGTRAKAIFAAARASASYSSKFDLILAGWQAIPDWNKAAMAASGNYDTLDVAAYVFGQLNDASSDEAIYGSMFAEPETINSLPGGLMVQEAATAAGAAHPAKLSVYETNMGTVSGSASQAQVNTAIASVGAGINTANNMLLMLRDLGVTDQNMFALPGLFAPYTGLKGSKATTSPIWGIVIDMGGPTNLVRPTYLAEQLTNSAILPTLLNTSQTGANPTWNQKRSLNDNVANPNAHYIQSFAFTDGKQVNVVLFNLSRTTALPVNFAGANAPLGAATISTLTASDINANNETQENVAITHTSQTLKAGTTLSLPPFSMTVVSTGASTQPTAVTGVKVSCAKTSLSPQDTAACSATVNGTGDYSSDVTWSVDNGTISSDGLYTAPAAAPNTGQAVVTATSVADPTKKASFTIAVGSASIKSVSLTCPTGNLAQGARMACTAKVSGTGNYSAGVNWSASAGTIDAKGNFTAPSTGTSVIITATSVQDPSKSGSQTVSLFASLVIGTPSYTSTPTTATITWQTNVPAHSGLSYGTTTGYSGGTTPWVPTASTTANLTLTGLKPSSTYFALLFSITNTQTVYKTFTFTTGKAQGITGVSVNCPSTSLKGGATMTCTSQVTGTGTFSQNVTWSASAGTISASGVFTAPSNGSSAVIKATSTGDPTKSATATVKIDNPQSTAPKMSITGVTSTVTANTATIKWSTGVMTHSGISYGPTLHYGSGTTPYDPVATTTPSLTLKNLRPGTTYYLFLFSSNDKQVVTKTYTLTTAK